MTSSSASQSSPAPRGAATQRAAPQSRIAWRFPLPRTHTGIPLGNGRQGLLIWGGDAPGFGRANPGDAEDRRQTLCVTVGRPGFWDHRGGNAFSSRTTYAEVRACLERGDHARLTELFAAPAAPADSPGARFPTQLGGGRLELRLPGSWRPQRGLLDLRSGSAVIVLADHAGAECDLRVHQAFDQELAWIDLPEAIPAAELVIRLRPSFAFAGEAMQYRGIAAPREFAVDDGSGFVQELPADVGLGMAWRRSGQRIVIATALGETPGDDPGAAARAALLDPHPTVRALATANGWKARHDLLPRLIVDDPVVQTAWDLGLHKLLAATAPGPGSVPCALQGPWLEEYQIPPWSSDYHFNINVEMVYQPLLIAGAHAHLTPLWDLLRSWMPTLRANGRAFFGTDDALMLPHAVDDRCAAVGSFWTGMIDHGCTAWMGLLAFADYRTGGDLTVLREVAWPLLCGAHAGYRAMAEQREGQWSLPVSVSPEFGGCRHDAWGRDASFQLAAWHAVLRALPRAASALQLAIDPAWAATASSLPAVTTVRAPHTREYPEMLRERIALWAGKDLPESHRHHSHLAGIWPFATLDLHGKDPVHRALVADSLHHWVRMGPGAWSGWCVPWAAAICARVGFADGALAWLDFWQSHFVNEGHGTLHDGAFPGGTTLINLGSGDDSQHGEIMQLDAAGGAVSAIAELLLQDRGDHLAVLPAIPRRWRSLRCSRLRAPGGFEIGFTVEEWQVREVDVLSLRGEQLHLAHGLGATWIVDDGSAVRSCAGPRLTCETKPGQRLRAHRT